MTTGKTWQERVLDEMHAESEIRTIRRDRYKESPAVLGFAIYKLTSGPDANALYTCRQQIISDWETFADASTTDYKLRFANLPKVAVEAGAAKPLNGKIVAARRIGTKSDGTPLIYCFEDLPRYVPVNPKTVYNATFDREAADNTTWVFAVDALTNDGLKVMHQIATGYNDAGDKTLYGFYRIETYDIYGRLVDVTAETRVAVDAAGACS